TSDRVLAPTPSIQTSQEIEDYEPITEVPTLSASYLEAFQTESDYRITLGEAVKYVISFVGSFGPLIPGIPIAMIMARQHFHSDIAGYVMIGVGVVSDSAINTWMINELMDDTQRLFRAVKKPQDDSKMFYLRTAKNVGIGVSSIVLG